ncbi:short-chain dehydrogenase [Pilimelia terevasa]|uniref:Short-chain dehydrogenase n=1 Tax=Pilimelia terevasa TaxID=53372 RepID=A0A8J3BVL2_9ACTN|nr:SDR family NAD(P)-dependent oxidoreductase [Pilimelia terevasa]GGK39487.1 short-chain dehydrogenase [Pilimelia terevasa]
MPVALVTGASAGLGRALAAALADQRWTLILDGRRPGPLAAVAAALADRAAVTAVPGDVADPAHRADLAAAATAAGGLDLLVNNASSLGPTPLPALRDLDAADLAAVLEVNVTAPLALIRAALPRPGGVVVNISSDAAVAHYPHWGAYGASKAALDHLTATLAAENPGVRWYAVDPGDMRTAMHQAAFPGADISDRPLPASVVPALLRLLDEAPASGRYRAADLAAAVPA